MTSGGNDQQTARRPELRRASWLLLVLLVAPICGCLPPFVRQPVGDPAPVVFASPQPTKEEVINVVNANSYRIRQLQSESATLRVPGLPAMRANLAVELPRRFRLSTNIWGLPGTGLDLGSNEELFWVWIEQSQPRAVYYARHDDFARSPARQNIPIEPDWLIEALGVVVLDPAGIHEGPFWRNANQMEIRSRIPTPAGDMTKTTVVHSRYGWILEQHVYDSTGQLIASARASEHRFYAATGVTLPHRLELELAPGQPSQMSLKIDVSSYLINRLYGDPSQLWSIPQPRGVPLVNIADPNFRPPLSNSPPTPTGSPGNWPRNAHQPFRPSYRGVLR